MIKGRKLQNNHRKKSNINYNECLLIKSLRRWIIDFWSCFIRRFKSLLTDNPGTSTQNAQIKSQDKLIQLNSPKGTCELRRRKRKKSNNYQAKIVNKYQETILTISHRSDTDFSKLCKNQSQFSLKALNCDVKSIDKTPSICRVKSSQRSFDIRTESLYNLEKRKYSDGETVEVKWLPGPFFDRSQSESHISDFEKLKKKNETKKLNDRMKRRRVSKIPRLKRNEIACKKHSN